MHVYKHLCMCLLVYMFCVCVLVFALTIWLHQTHCPTHTSASGSDQSTKNELPASVLKRGKYVCDLVRQCSKVGELRTAIQQGVMTEKEVGTIHDMTLLCCLVVWLDHVMCTSVLHVIKPILDPCGLYVWYYSMFAFLSVIHCTVCFSVHQVYAEIGEIVCGRKKGREGDEMIVVDLTGTGAQDAAIGQWAWNTLKNV